MESRTIMEYKVYLLNLADVRGNVDRYTTVAVFDSKQKLEDYYVSQLAEATWQDEPSSDYFGVTHSYNKAFKKGSLLEWFNPDIGFSQVTERWIDAIPSQEEFTVSFNPES